MAAFEDCLAKGRLKEVEPNAESVANELETAKEELERARASYTSGNWNDTAMQSYFAMTRCARAGINSRGYKDTNLYGLQVALEHLFVQDGELPKTVGKQIRDAKDVKDAVYNGRRASPHEARQMLMWAQQFAKAIFTKLALPGFDADEIQTNLPEPVDPQRERPRSSERDRERPRRQDWNQRSDRGARSGWGQRSDRGSRTDRPYRSDRPTRPKSDDSEDWASRDPDAWRGGRV